MSIRQTKKLFPLLTLIIAITLFLSCKKDNVNNQPGSETPDLTTTVNASVSGFVTDQNNAPADGATVKFGSLTTTTNQFGFFEIKNTDVAKNAAMLTISKNGYFKSIRSFETSAGKSSFVRIKLLPNTISGSFDAASGGTVTLSNGLSVSLPANAVVNAATSSTYTGTVNVSSYWLDPTATDNAETRPGGNRAIDTDGHLKFANSFGGAAVELTGATGELLQIASGKKATLNIPIPSSLAASAPSTIILSYVDETNGLWKQDGSATKSGNSYTGEVSHFSFWDGQIYGTYVHFEMTVLDANNNPIANTYVSASINNNTSIGYGFTDANGYVGGLIPDNQQVLIKVLPDFTNCNNGVFTQTVTTSGTDISLGNVNATITLADVSGTLTNCNNQAVTDGRVYINKSNHYETHLASNNGTFNFSTMLCPNSTNTVTFVGQDISNLQLSTELTYNLVQGSNVIGNLVACSVTAPEYFVYTIDGTSTTFSSPGNSFWDYGGNWSPYRYASGGGSGANQVLVTYNPQNIGPNSVLPLISFRAQGVDSMIVTTPIQLFMTEFGNIDEHMSGNFSGTLTSASNSNTTYNVSCNFRIKRGY